MAALWWAATVLALCAALYPSLLAFMASRNLGLAFDGKNLTYRGSWGNMRVIAGPSIESMYLQTYSMSAAEIVGGGILQSRGRQIARALSKPASLSTGDCIALLVKVRGAPRPVGFRLRFFKYTEVLSVLQAVASRGVPVFQGQ